MWPLQEAEEAPKLYVLNETRVKLLSEERRSRTDAVERSLLFRSGRRTRHQLDEFAVELVLIEIFLNHHLLFAEPRLAARHPDESVAIARAVIHRNVHVEAGGLGDDARIEPGRGSQLVPQVAGLRVLCYVLGSWRGAFPNLRDQILVHVRFYGNIHRGYHDSRPRRMKHFVRRFGIEPEIEFAARRSCKFG